MIDSYKKYLGFVMFPEQPKGRKEEKKPNKTKHHKTYLILVLCGNH